MKFTAVLKTGTAKKTGNEYRYLELPLSSAYRKKAFLTEAEVALINATDKNEFPANLSEGVGKDSGKPYTCLDVYLSDDCIKKVFLDSAELALIRLSAQQG